ncbi:MAG: hypothetical protein KF724_08945 [Phycisphaeraceae bacterium]|nr:hypothetical protein [Phycisphaeraceae bacterium]
MMTALLVCVAFALPQQAGYILNDPGHEPGLSGLQFVKWGERTTDGFLVAHYRGSITDSAMLAQRRSLSAPRGADLEQATHAYRTHARQIAAATGEYLRTSLGPAWRVTPIHNASSIEFAGPADDRNGRMAILAEAIEAIGDQIRSKERADTLTDDRERDEAIAKSNAAASRAEQALSQVRIMTRVLQIQHAVGEDAARALKLALPWGSFSAVGGTQIVASGTMDELDAATLLIAQLDRVAMVEAAETAEASAARRRDTPSGRLLANPININFPGGALPEYLGMVGGAAGAQSWVLEDPRLARAYVPEIKLTGVTADSALRMLDGLTFPSADKAFPVNARLAVQRIDAAPGSESPPIYRIGANFPGAADPESGKSPSPRTVTGVFEVGLQHLGDSDEDLQRIAKEQAELLATIEIGIELNGPSESFRLKLHSPTGMLFVSGTGEELALVRTIIEKWASQR